MKMKEWESYESCVLEKHMRVYIRPIQTFACKEGTRISAQAGKHVSKITN